jgi:hypothetical protein
MMGRPIRVGVQPELTAHRGKLLSGDAKGVPVHAGSLLRKRTITLDTALLSNSGEFLRILVHELFHFVWPKLGNPRRLAFEAILCLEMRRSARGELGWSAEERKVQLTAEDVDCRSRRWREYVCESFCDTAAWYLGGRRQHKEATLAQGNRHSRERWFDDLLSAAILRV